MIDQETQQRRGEAKRGAVTPPPVTLSEEPSPEVAETFESPQIGEYLRRQRVLRDVSLDELAAMTLIPLRSLERLEDGELDGETDGFARGFVRTVAAALGLDVDDAIARMLQEPSAGAWELRSPRRRAKQMAALAALGAILVVALLVLQAGWQMLVGASAVEPSRAVVIWRDPVRALADAAGAEVDPAGEIDPSRGSRVEPPVPDGALGLAADPVAPGASRVADGR